MRFSGLKSGKNNEIKDVNICQDYRTAINHESAQTAIAHVFSDKPGVVQILQSVIYDVGKVGANIDGLSAYQISALQTLRKNDNHCDELNEKLSKLIRLVNRQSEKDGKLIDRSDHPVINDQNELDVRLVIDWILREQYDDVDTHKDESTDIESTISLSIPGRDLLSEDDSMRSHVDANLQLQKRAQSVGLEIREASGQTRYNFTNLPSRPSQLLAVMTQDLEQGDRKQAKDHVQSVGGRLPLDIDRGDEDKYPDNKYSTLYPEQSDFDAIIETLPGDDALQQGFLFGQLIGIKGWYRTDACGKGNAGCAVGRDFFEFENQSFRDHYGIRIDNGYVRAIRRDLS